MAHDIESPESLAWAELLRRGSIPPRYLKGLQDEIASELALCLDPFIHEQDIRPYGAIVSREMPHIDRLGTLIPTGGVEPAVIRSLADGRHSVVLRVQGEPPRLLLLNESMDTDQDCALHAVWVDGVILCNDASGIVRVVTDSSVTLVEGRRWIAKNLVFEAAEDIVDIVPASDIRIVRRLLELTHHRISAHRVGATLLYLLGDNPRPTSRRGEGVALAALELSVLNENEEPLWIHLARYRDGALLIGDDGRLLAANVIMRSSRSSESAVTAIGGTRHTSAARHTYDCPDVLAFVVSTDGPVTVFSDGKRIAELKAASPPLPRKTAERIGELIALRDAER
jgi:DNA integrity scanning protein DisA with diadenylate cyclase activity